MNELNCICGKDYVRLSHFSFIKFSIYFLCKVEKRGLKRCIFFPKSPRAFLGKLKPCCFLIFVSLCVLIFSMVCSLHHKMSYLYIIKMFWIIMGKLEQCFLNFFLTLLIFVMIFSLTHKIVYHFRGLDSVTGIKGNYTFFKASCMIFEKLKPYYFLILICLTVIFCQNSD